VTVGTMAVVVSLDDPAAEDPQRAGAKAAALARALRAGLPVLPGFVITTGADAPPRELVDAARDHWETLTAHDSRPLVVRSSSPIEDAADSSMAGRFTTVVGVSGWDEFANAVELVLESALEVARDDGLADAGASMAVLVQPLVEPKAAGVLFGVDPVTGRPDRRVVAAVSGLPERLVSGEAVGARYELDPRGRRRGFDDGGEAVRLSRRQLRMLAALADRAAEVFGAPQDIEWAIDDRVQLSLLQSRPITTDVTGIPQGSVFGPGPVSETFPDPLCPIEEDLWVEPLRRALASLLDIVGHPANGSPLVATVGGRVALNLDILEATARAPWWAVARRIRTVRSAWRIGRLRRALPGLAEDAARAADDALAAVPPAETLTDRQLVATLARSRDALVSLHAHEMLMGMVLGGDPSHLTASSVALRVLASARAEGISDRDIPRRHPVVLALVPPQVGPHVDLPAQLALPDWTPGEDERAATLREALRMRVRWVQELGARFTWTLGERLARRGQLDDPSQVRGLDLHALEMTVRGLAVTNRQALVTCPTESPPLPMRFRLSADGTPVPATDACADHGTGAGGGRGRGVVHVGVDDVPEGAVLVVDTLDSRLAPLLGRLNGLVAETGSVLAHLAILARESSVPTVVAFPGATRQFAPGTVVTVDGATGEVLPVAGAPTKDGA